MQIGHLQRGVMSIQENKGNGSNSPEWGPPRVVTEWDTGAEA